VSLQPQKIPFPATIVEKIIWLETPLNPEQVKNIA